MDGFFLCIIFLNLLVLCCVCSLMASLVIKEGDATLSNIISKYVSRPYPIILPEITTGISNPGSNPGYNPGSNPGSDSGPNSFSDGSPSPSSDKKFKNWDNTWQVSKKSHEIYGQWVAPSECVISSITIHATGAFNNGGYGVIEVWVIHQNPNSISPHGAYGTTRPTNILEGTFDLADKNIRLKQGEKLQIRWTMQSPDRMFNVLEKNNLMALDITVK